MQVYTKTGGRNVSRISGKGVRMYKGMGVCSADFSSFFLKVTKLWYSDRRVHVPKY